MPAPLAPPGGPGPAGEGEGAGQVEQAGPRGALGAAGRRFARQVASEGAIVAS